MPDYSSGFSPGFDAEPGSSPATIPSVTRLGLHGGPRPQYAGFAPAGPSLTVTGGPFTEAQIRAGGQSIVLTLVNDEFVSTVGDSGAETTALINGLVSDGVETFGWNNVVQAGLTFSDVTRDSPTQVTILLPAFPTYDITANETITVTVPATITTSETESVSGDKVLITVVAVVVPTPGGGGGAEPSGRGWGYKKPSGRRRRDEAVIPQAEGVRRNYGPVLEEEPSKPELEALAKIRTEAEQSKEELLALRDLEEEASKGDKRTRLVRDRLAELRQQIDVIERREQDEVELLMLLLAMMG